MRLQPILVYEHNFTDSEMRKIFTQDTISVFISLKLRYVAITAAQGELFKEHRGYISKDTHQAGRAYHQGSRLL